MTNYRNLIGAGSWYVRQSYENYKDHMTVNEYLRYIDAECIERVKSYGISKGDLLRLTYISGERTRRYVGTFKSMVNSHINIKQRNRLISLSAHFIDDIEVVRI